MLTAVLVAWWRDTCLLRSVKDSNRAKLKHNSLLENPDKNTNLLNFMADL